MEICDKFLCVNRKNKECHVPKNVVAFTCKHTNAPCPKARCEYCDVKECEKQYDGRIDRMSMISEQVKEIKACAYAHEASGDAIYGTANILYQAADTIEALSAKLQTANKELERWHTDKINDKIKNPFARISASCCHNCDHKDEYIEELEAADMERSADDCGGGWILCKDRLPGEKEGVKIGSTDEEFLVTIKNFSGGEYCTVSRFEEPIQDFWHDNVVAWKLKPEPCHEH